MKGTFEWSKRDSTTRYICHSFFLKDAPRHAPQNQQVDDQKETLSMHVLYQSILQNDYAIVHWLLKEEAQKLTTYKVVHKKDVSNVKSNNLHSSTSGGGMG